MKKKKLKAQIIKLEREINRLEYRLKTVEDKTAKPVEFRRWRSLGEIKPFGTAVSAKEEHTTSLVEDYIDRSVVEAESREDIAQKLRRIADLAYGYDSKDKFFNLPRDAFRKTLITAARMLQMLQGEK